MNENQIEHKILISHSTEDWEYVQLFVKLLSTIGLQNDKIICTSVPGYGIPEGKEIFDWLRQQFVDYDLHVIYVLSKNYYASASCLNEMGAAWIKKTTDTLLLLPGFEFSEIKGCVSSEKIGIKLDSSLSELKHRLNELKDMLQEKYNLPKIAAITWEMNRDDFIKNVIKKFNENQVSHGIIKSIEYSEYALTLLRHASDNGKIEYLQTLSGEYIKSGKKEFIGSNQTPRNIAMWKNGINELLEKHLIKKVEDDENTYEVTAEGYNVVDYIKNKSLDI